MLNFETYVLAQIKQTLSAADPALLRDAYVVSFFVHDYEDDPRLPILTVGCNTDARWRSCTPAPGQQPRWPIASDSDEAKWNYAFWLQNEITVIGEPDTEGAGLRKEWFKARGLWFEDDLFDSDQDNWERIAAQMTSSFVGMCVQVACTLHADGSVVGSFGKVVPIVVHELEYYDEIAEQTERANPPGVAAAFVSWVRSL